MAWKRKGEERNRKKERERERISFELIYCSYILCIIRKILNLLAFSFLYRKILSDYVRIINLFLRRLDGTGDERHYYWATANIFWPLKHTCQLLFFSFSFPSTFFPRDDYASSLITFKTAWLGRRHPKTKLLEM